MLTKPQKISLAIIGAAGLLALLYYWGWPKYCSKSYESSKEQECPTFCKTDFFSDYEPELGIESWGFNCVPKK